MSMHYYDEEVNFFEKVGVMPSSTTLTSDAQGTTDALLDASDAEPIMISLDIVTGAIEVKARELLALIHEKETDIFGSTLHTDISTECHACMMDSIYSSLDAVETVLDMAYAFISRI